MPETSRSTRSGLIGRLRQAMEIERSSLPRSNGWRSPSFLTTLSPRSWTRSKVEKRAPQLSHWRRRRIEAPSSVGRLSFTWLSGWRQNGQRTFRLQVRVDRKAGAERLDAVAYRCLDLAVASLAILAQAFDHFGDQAADFLELGSAEPARCAGRRAEANARRD